ncbi:MAG TPA: ABC transporter permease [Gemmatimonadaceae bacterium]|nr:ABC transporter permease [Gemmatimonadaceae bacterium]
MLPPRVRRLLRLDVRDRERLAGDVNEEIAFHIEQRTQQLIARGLSAADARAEALRRFGAAYLEGRSIHASARHREDHMRLAEWRDALAHDIRHGIRLLGSSPGFTAVVTLTLALGIGATTAIFSVVDTALLRPLPYPAAERLVVLSDLQGELVAPASYPEFHDWRTHGGGIFSAIGVYFLTQTSLTGAGEPEVLRGVRGSSDVPRMLGLTILRGRALGPDDDLRSSEAVLLIGEGLWRRRFGGDPAVVGSTLTVQGQPAIVVGIVRADARAVPPQGLSTGEAPEIFLPLRLDESVAPRGLHFMTVLAQLAPGVPLSQARERLGDVAERLRSDGATTHGITMIPVTERVIGDVGGRLGLLFGAVGVLLLIACVNVANLLLARMAERHHEMAVRMAIGASRGRLIGQLLVESILRALLGGLLGVLIAWGSLVLARAWLPGRVPRADQIALDGRVLLFAFALSVGTGLLFGLLPALRAAGRDTAGALREGARGLTGGASGDRVRAALVVGEVALSFVLLAGAALLIQSFGRLSSVELGFDDGRTLTGYVLLPSSRYPDSTTRIAFFDRLTRRVASVPGVQGVALSSDLPVEGGTNGGFSIEGRTFPPGDPPLAEKRIVSANYFEMLRARLVEGRTFDGRDVLGAPAVMVVNESFARLHFPGTSAVGQRVAFSWGIEGMQTVIGVVADIREGALDRAILPAMYVNVAQRASDGMHVLVRTAGEPSAMAPALRAAVLDIDSALPISGVRTLRDVVRSGIRGSRLSATLVGIFSIVALVLAAIGLYGVISFSVMQRRHEMGIRTALGARASDVLRLVLWHGVVLVVIGLAVGLLLAMVSGRLVASQLYGIAASDGRTLAVTASVLALAGLAAAAIPAARAARTDPMVALRAE